MFISSLFYVIIESKNFFYKKSFYFYPIEKCVKKGLKMTFISSQSVHLVTFLSNHQFKKLLLQKVFVFSSIRKMCLKRIKNDIHFATTGLFCHLSVQSLNQETSFTKKFLYFYPEENYVKKGLKMEFILLQSVHFIT